MTKTNLVLHCGSRAVNRETLSRVPCPPPTETWHPISHIQLVNEVERSLQSSGMRIVEESFGLSADGSRMFGLCRVANCKETQDYAYVIGLRGAIDKSLSRGLAVGSSVFVCDNLAFSGEIEMHRKQTKNIMEDLPLMVDTAIAQLAAKWDNQGKRIQAYKNTGITDDQALRLLYNIAGDVFPEQRFFDINREFLAPRHAEFQKNTLWALFNSVTEFLKPRTDTSKASGLWTMPARTMRLHKACDDFAGLVIDTTAVVTPIAPTQVEVTPAVPVEAPATAPATA